MYLVTTVKTKTRIDPDTGEPGADQSIDANVVDSDERIDRLLALKAAGDDNLANTKVFRLKVGPKGRPVVGSERRV